jgi:hypothetical protein
MTARPMGISPHGQLVPWAARPMESSPHGQLAPWTSRPKDSSPHGHLAPWTPCPMDNSPHSGLLGYSDDSSSEIVSHRKCMYNVKKKFPVSAQRHFKFMMWNYINPLKIDLKFLSTSVYFEFLASF